MNLAATLAQAPARELASFSAHRNGREKSKPFRSFIDGGSIVQGVMFVCAIQHTATGRESRSPRGRHLSGSGGREIGGMEAASAADPGVRPRGDRYQPFHAGPACLGLTYVRGVCRGWRRSADVFERVQHIDRRVLDFDIAQRFYCARHVRLAEPKISCKRPSPQGRCS